MTKYWDINKRRGGYIAHPTNPNLTELADFTDLQSSLTLTPGVTLDLYDQMGTWNDYLFIVTSYSLYFLSLISFSLTFLLYIYIM